MNKEKDFINMVEDFINYLHYLLGLLEVELLEVEERTKENETN